MFFAFLHEIGHIIAGVILMMKLEKIEIIREDLKESVPKIDKLFKNTDFNEIILALDEYDKNVEKHYKEYLRTNEVWDCIKEILKGK